MIFIFSHGSYRANYIYILMNNMPIKKANLFEWKEIKGLATGTGSLSKYFLNIIALFLVVLPNLVPSMLEGSNRSRPKFYINSRSGTSRIYAKILSNFFGFAGIRNSDVNLSRNYAWMVTVRTEGLGHITGVPCYFCMAYLEDENFKGLLTVYGSIVILYYRCKSHWPSF